MVIVTDPAGTVFCRVVNPWTDGVVVEQTFGTERDELATKPAPVPSRFEATTRA
jgi:hypothetical protein